MFFFKLLQQLNDTVKSKELQINELTVKQNSEEDAEKLKAIRSNTAQAGKQRKDCRRAGKQGQGDQKSCRKC